MPTSTVRRVALGDVATIRGGFVPSATEARERNRREEEVRRHPTVATGTPFSARGLQPSAIGHEGVIAWEDLVAMLPVRDATRYEVHDGDLLLPLRSQRIQAAVARNVPEGVIAIGQWAIITPREDKADVDYLAWYLNHPRSQARLAGSMMGTSLRFLTVSSVRAFDVELPSLALQRRLGRVGLLTSKLTILESKLALLRQQYTDALGMAVVDGRAARRAAPTA